MARKKVARATGRRYDAARMMNPIKRSASSLDSLFRFRMMILLREVPLMAFGICGAIPAMAVFSIRGLLKDGGACFPGALEMFVDILHVDVEALRCLAEALRVAITGRRSPHHNPGCAKLPRGVIDLAI